VGATIGLMGDVMLGRGVAERLSETDPAEVWSAEVRELASRCDLLICNLECCVSERGRPTSLVAGKPFFFRGPLAAVESLKAVGTSAVGLANNHALDFGPEALADTLRHLEHGGVASTGAGRGAEARRGVVVDGPRLRLGLLAVSDHPREYAAAPGGWGIAYAELWEGPPPWLLSELRRLRGLCDLVVVFPHWGPNMTVRPAPWQRALAAELIGAGADLVAGHSAHVFHGIESLETGLVLYDLGDALDDYAVDRSLRNDLGIFALWRPDRDGGSLELVGLRLDFCRTDLAVGEDADWITARLDRACGELGTSVERIGEQQFRVRGS
jgi:poly-gamma-glutamate capsule biosynthesis protein CapA/YwtB (metallophosphatase superfamily)